MSKICEYTNGPCFMPHFAVLETDAGPSINKALTNLRKDFEGSSNLDEVTRLAYQARLADDILRRIGSIESGRSPCGNCTIKAPLGSKSDGPQLTMTLRLRSEW